MSSEMHWIKFRINPHDDSKEVNVFPNQKIKKILSKQWKKIIALSGNFGLKHFSNTKDVTEVILLLWSLDEAYAKFTVIVP